MRGPVMLDRPSIASTVYQAGITELLALRGRHSVRAQRRVATPTFRGAVEDALISVSPAKIFRCSC